MQLLGIFNASGGSCACRSGASLGPLRRRIPRRWALFALGRDKHSGIYFPLGWSRGGARPSFLNESRRRQILCVVSEC